MNVEQAPERHAHADEPLATLRGRLREIAARIDPFPAFPGAMFAYGIEVPAPDDADVGSPDTDAADAGCVILGNDGELYELRIGIDAEQLALGGDHVATRHEELVPLDLPPDALRSYVLNAIATAEAYLARSQPRGSAGRGGPGERGDA